MSGKGERGCTLAQLAQRGFGGSHIWDNWSAHCAEQPDLGSSAWGRRLDRMMSSSGPFHFQPHLFCDFLIFCLFHSRLVSIVISSDAVYFSRIKKGVDIFLWSMKWEVPTSKKCYLSSRSAFFSNTRSDFCDVSNKNFLPEIDFY